MTAARSRRRLVTAAVAGAALITASACSSGGDGGKAPKDELVLVQAQAPSTMNPNIERTPAILRVQNQVLEAAVQAKYTDGKYVLTPTLVTGWEQTGSNEWTFKVRPNVKFSNGEKLTSAAFDSTLDAVFDYDGSKLAFFFKGWDIKTIDDMSFKVITPKADDSTVPGIMTQFFVLPPAYYEEVGAVAFGEKPIGTGPYLLREFKQGTELHFGANPDYWGTKPKIKNVIVRAVPEDASRVSNLLAGQADIIDAIPQPLMSRVEGSKDFETRAIASGGAVYLMFNMNQKPLNDVRVRQAINYAVDNHELVSGLFGKTAVPMDQWYVSVYPGRDNSYDPYPFDVEKAKQLLAEAGYPDGVDVDFYFSIGERPLDQQAAEAIQAQLLKAGIRVKMHGGDPNTIKSQFAGGKVSGFYMNSYIPPSLDVATLFAYYLTPGSAYSTTAASPRAATLVQQAVVAADPKQRAALYNQAQEIFLGEEALFVPLWAPVDTWGVAKGVQFQPEPLQAYYLNEISFAD